MIIIIIIIIMPPDSGVTLHGLQKSFSKIWKCRKDYLICLKSQPYRVVAPGQESTSSDLRFKYFEHRPKISSRWLWDAWGQELSFFRFVVQEHRPRIKGLIHTEFI